MHPNEIAMEGQVWFISGSLVESGYTKSNGTQKQHSTEHGLTLHMPSSPGVHAAFELANDVDNHMDGKF